MTLFSILSREHRIFVSVSLCYFCIRYFNGVCTRLCSLWTISLVFVLKSFSSFYHLTMISNRLLIWPYGKWIFSKQNFVSHLTDTIKKNTQPIAKWILIGFGVRAFNFFYPYDKIDGDSSVSCSWLRIFEDLFFALKKKLHALKCSAYPGMLYPMILSLPGLNKLGFCCYISRFQSLLSARYRKIVRELVYNVLCWLVFSACYPTVRSFDS